MHRGLAEPRGPSVLRDRAVRKRMSKLQARVGSVGPSLDNAAPACAFAAAGPAKKKQLAAERQAQIDHRNRRMVERIYEMFPALAPLDGNLGGYLSGGEQQMLTIGRTLMGNPSLLLLDEPVEGVAPIVVQELGRQIHHLKDMGLTILFSEQNLQFATKISDRAYIIEKGCIQFQGTIEELEKNSEIQEKYLMI